MANKKLDHVEEADEVKTETVVAETNKDSEKLVTVFVPYVPGDDPEETVIINGYVTKFRKGEQVQVKTNVAEVLENKYQQSKLAQKNREKFKEQVQDL